MHNLNVRKLLQKADMQPTVSLYNKSALPLNSDEGSENASLSWIENDALPNTASAIQRKRAETLRGAPKRGSSFSLGKHGDPENPWNRCPLTVSLPTGKHTSYRLRHTFSHLHRTFAHAPTPSHVRGPQQTATCGCGTALVRQRSLKLLFGGQGCMLS